MIYLIYGFFRWMYKAWYLIKTFLGWFEKEIILIIFILNNFQIGIENFTWMR